LNWILLEQVVEELLTACDRLLHNASLPIILHCLLAIGNHLNAKRLSKDVPGFQISSIDKVKKKNKNKVNMAGNKMTRLKEQGKRDKVKMAGKIWQG
jgi:hypothetical protein